MQSNPILKKKNNDITELNPQWGMVCTAETLKIKFSSAPHNRIVRFLYKKYIPNVEKVAHNSIYNSTDTIDNINGGIKVDVIYKAPITVSIYC